MGIVRPAKKPGGTFLRGIGRAGSEQAVRDAPREGTSWYHPSNAAAVEVVYAPLRPDTVEPMTHSEVDHER